MHRLTLISLVLLSCAANANLFGTLLGSEKEVVVVAGDDQTQSKFAQDPAEEKETGVALIENDSLPLAAAMDDLTSEGQSGVVIRAKRYYGCGCGCCGCGCCATMAPAATMMPCGCGCCGCGWG